MGKNDGSVEGGTRYFTCPDKHGLFLQPKHLRVAKEASDVDPSKWSSHVGIDDGVRTRSQSLHLAKVQPEPAPRSVIPTAAMSQSLQQAKVQSGPFPQSAVSSAVVSVGVAGSNAGVMQSSALSPNRPAASIADNSTKFAITGGPVPPSLMSQLLLRVLWVLVAMPVCNLQPLCNL